MSGLPLESAVKAARISCSKVAVSFLDQSGLNARIQAELAQLNVDDVNALAETGAKIRQSKEASGKSSAVADERTATAMSGLPLESAVKAARISCSKVNVLIAIKEVFASLYNDRAISYRVHQGFDHDIVALYNHFT
jgi:pyruvate,water dikinase